jgi:hypothetical protein
MGVLPYFRVDAGAGAVFERSGQINIGLAVIRPYEPKAVHLPRRYACDDAGIVFAAQPFGS